MESPNPDPESQPPKPFLPRFGIAEMMLAMMIFCVMGAALGYLRRANQDHSGRPLFVIFTLAAPIALVVVLSSYMNLKRWLNSK